MSETEGEHVAGAVLLARVILEDGGRVLDMLFEVDATGDVAEVTAYRPDTNRKVCFRDGKLRDMVLGFASSVESLYHLRDGALSDMDKAIVLSSDPLKEIASRVLELSRDRLGYANPRILLVESIKLISENIPRLLISTTPMVNAPSTQAILG